MMMHDAPIKSLGNISPTNSVNPISSVSRVQKKIMGIATAKEIRYPINCHCIYIYICIYLFVCLFICLSIYFYLFIYLSVFPQQRKLMGFSTQNSSGVHWCRRRVRFNEVPEKVPEKAWEALV